MRNILDVAVSYYEHVYTRIPTKGNLFNLLTTDRYKSCVMRVRAEKNPKKKKELKAQLPVFTPCGLFRGLEADSLRNLTGFICIDIDKKDNLNVENYSNLKEEFSKLPYIAFCAHSVSGEGYYAIIPLAYPDKFLYHFRCLQQDFAKMDITIDPACSDISRKRFVSYDSEPYINQGTETYKGLADELSLPTTTTISRSDTVNDSALFEEVSKYLHVIEEKRIDITTGRENWFRIGCALFNAFGESAREMFHSVSQFYPDYNYNETDRLFSNITKSSSNKPVTIKTFFRYARQYGVNAVVDFM